MKGGTPDLTLNLLCYLFVTITEGCEGRHYRTVYIHKVYGLSLYSCMLRHCSHFVWMTEILSCEENSLWKQQRKDPADLQPKSTFKSLTLFIFMHWRSKPHRYVSYSGSVFYNFGVSTQIWGESGKSLSYLSCDFMRKVITKNGRNW